MSSYRYLISDVFFSVFVLIFLFFFFFSSRRRHTRSDRDWSSDVCSSDLPCGVPCTLVFTLLLLPLALTQKFLPATPHGWLLLAGCALSAQVLGQGLEIGRASCRERV